MSEFLANMSHELRTPLNSIIGFTKLLHAGKVGPLSATQKEYLGDVLDSSNHLLELINDVLELAKVDAGRTVIFIESVDLAKVSREIHDILRGAAAEKRIELRVEVSPALGAVAVDARLFKQILYNYLSNAIKFTPDGGKVAMRITACDEDSFRVEVEDTGVGVRPEDMGRLFVEFQQLESGLPQRHRGSGLGLALTRRIVEAQGGRVEVRSVFGAGSTFAAILPRRAASAELAPGSTPSGAR